METRACTMNVLRILKMPRCPNGNNCECLTGLSSAALSRQSWFLARTLHVEDTAAVRWQIGLTRAVWRNSPNLSTFANRAAFANNSGPSRLLIPFLLNAASYFQSSAFLVVRNPDVFMFFFACLSTSLFGIGSGSKYGTRRQNCKHLSHRLLGTEDAMHLGMRSANAEFWWCTAVLWCCRYILA